MIIFLNSILVRLYLWELSYWESFSWDCVICEYYLPVIPHFGETQYKSNPLFLKLSFTNQNHWEWGSIKWYKSTTARLGVEAANTCNGSDRLFGTLGNKNYSQLPSLYLALTVSVMRNYLQLLSLYLNYYCISTPFVTTVPNMPFFWRRAGFKFTSPDDLSQ